MATKAAKNNRKAWLLVFLLFLFLLAMTIFGRYEPYQHARQETGISEMLMHFR